MASGGRVTGRDQYLVLVVGSVLVGLPHGALDVAALPLARRSHRPRSDLAVVGLLYLVLGGAYLLAWVVAPLPAAAAFLLLTWVHWGQGDVYVLRSLYGADYVRDRVGVALTVLVRGGIPMVVPLLAFPRTYRKVVGTFVQPFGGEAAVWWLLDPTVRLVAGVGLGLVTLLALGRARIVASTPREWRLDAVETAGLWIAFLVIPPVLAIALYFTCWHSLRHLVRVVLLDDRSTAAVAGGRWWVPIGRLGVAAALPTIGALVLLGGLWFVAPAPPAGLPGVAGLGLVGIAVLTLPHVAVVTWLDRLDG